MATAMQPTFVVDKQGLAKLLERRGKEFAVIELIQNAWDEDTTRVDVTIEPVGRGMVRLVVEDDNPEGFKDLTHAYTLFAESAKKDDPTKRGRFNLGEKLVVAICHEASIETTKGTIVFTTKGRQHVAKKRKAGSRFTGLIRMTKEQVEAVEQMVFTLLPPHGITTTFNHKDVASRTPLRTFDAILRTERADDDGNLKATTRKAQVEIYDPLDGEQATIYEMGIPVVETGDRFHVNVMQKVPLNMDRDNVTPAYLRDLRTHVLNNTHDLLKPEDTKAAWVTNAMEDENAAPEAVKAAVTGRFGDKVVIADPTDPEANKIAASQGYTVIPGGALPKGAWANVKGGGIALPAGKVTPSPKPEGDGLEFMNPDHYPADMARVCEWAAAFGERLLGAQVEVRVTKEKSFQATYGPRDHGSAGVLTFFVGSLGFKWFRRENAQAQIDLILHEFGHHYCSDHLDRKYLNALTALGAKSTMLALSDAEFFFALTGTESGVTA